MAMDININSSLVIMLTDYTVMLRNLKLSAIEVKRNSMQQILLVDHWKTQLPRLKQLSEYVSQRIEHRTGINEEIFILELRLRLQDFEYALLSCSSTLEACGYWSAAEGSSAD